MLKKLLLTATLLVLALPAHAAPLKIVTSFSILQDITQNIATPANSVTTLVGVGQDAHMFQPKASDLAKLKTADVIVINGLGFEGWIQRAIEASGTKAMVVTASQTITPRANDPHAWQNVANVKAYVGVIAQALAKADPAQKQAFEAAAKAYTAKLETLDADIKKSIAALPHTRRSVLTSHDAFGYFEQAYGIAFLSPIGFSTESETTPKIMQALSQQIKTQNIGAVFIETTTNNKLVENLAKENNITVGGTLYGDALSTQTPTYVDLMRHNTQALVQALGTKNASNAGKP